MPASPRYFVTMQLPLLAAREFDHATATTMPRAPPTDH